jgi:tetratricopeptide (TPR) repeat protein
VVLPLLYLLFDRAFVAGTFGRALKQHGAMYLGLLVPIGVCVLIATGGHRGGLITDNPDVTWRYLLTQGQVISHYLWLSVFPYPLLVTYDWPLVEGVRESLPQSALVLALLLVSFWAVWKQPVWGFLGMVFFLVLAPTSSVIPIMTEVAAERRMYLPLLAVLVAGGVLVHGLIRAGVRWMPEAGPGWARAASAGGAVALAVVMGSVTFVRSLDYGSAFTLWEQTVRHSPTSSIAQTNYARMLMRYNRIDEAERAVRKSLTLNPRSARAMALLGMIHAKRGQWDEAAQVFLTAGEHLDGQADDYAFAGLALGMVGNESSSQHAFRRALELDPINSSAYIFQGNLAAYRGDHEAAIPFYRQALQLYPESALAWGNLGHSLSQLGRVEEAREAYRTATRLFPDSTDIVFNRAKFEASRGNLEASLPLFQRVLDLAPQHEGARLSMAIAMALADHPETGEVMQSLIVLHPRNLAARRAFAEWLIDQKRLGSADEQVRAGLQIDPDDPALRYFARRLDAFRAMPEFNPDAVLDPEVGGPPPQDDATPTAPTAPSL